MVVVWVRDHGSVCLQPHYFVGGGSVETDLPASRNSQGKGFFFLFVCLFVFIVDEREKSDRHLQGCPELRQIVD